MKTKPAYFQHSDKVIEADKDFRHVMAIALDPTTNYNNGVIRCITSREGDVEIKGYVDRSALYTICRNNSGKFEIGEKLEIKMEEKIINQLLKNDGDFIGLEDPDIWIDENTGLKHLYFTIPIIFNKKHGINEIHLGHAIGKDLDNLEMTIPVLSPMKKGTAKEVSIAPINDSGLHLNLVESDDRIEDIKYSVIKVAIANDMGSTWQWGKTVFHPAEHKISWIGGHASPGPLLPKEFIDIGKDKMLGIINGREANKKVGDKIKYGMFSVGLFIYDYEVGKIDWVSQEPLIRDTEAKTITFASQFVQTNKNEGILYAHVDDSFVRAYTLYADGLRLLLPKKFDTKE